MLDRVVNDKKAESAVNVLSVAPLSKIAIVLEAMDHCGIRYCHWKSNYHIEYAITAREDVDILVEESGFPDFVKIMADNGFRQADSVTNREQPGVYHFLGNDDDTGALINFHTYTRILTGDHFMKSWALPFGELLLSDIHSNGVIYMPPKSTEVIIYVIRNMIKHTTVFDLLLLLRAGKATSLEYDWLLDGMDLNDAQGKLATYFPEISAADFERALVLVGEDGSLLDRIRLGFRFRNRLKKYRRYSQFTQTTRSFVAAGKMAISKFGRKEKHMTFLSGGKVIALVGPQATGKSTIANAIRGWLGQELSIAYIHSGKPPMTWLTFLPGMLIPLARSLLPEQRSVNVEIKAEAEKQPGYPMVFVLRKLMLAYDRRALLRRAFQASRNGKIILSDRYPSDTVGAIDGATFTDAAIAAEKSALKRWMMSAERRLYADICPPDFVLQLTVSVDKAIERNRERVKPGFKQSTEYVKARHGQKHKPEFHRCPVVKISTDGELDDTVLIAKRAVWMNL